MKQKDEKFSYFLKNRLLIISQEDNSKPTKATLTKIRKEVEKINYIFKEYYKKLKDFKKIFASKVSSKLTLKKLLEDKIFDLYQLEKNLEEIKNYYKLTKEKFGNNKLCKKAIKDMEKGITQLENLKADIENTISELSKTASPGFLKEKKNKILRECLDVLKKEVSKFSRRKDSKTKPKLVLKKQFFMAGMPKNNVIRFARYIPILNVPTIKGGSKKAYIVLFVDVKTPKTRKGKIVGKIDKLNVAVTLNIIDPAKIKKSFQVTGTMTFKNALSYLFFDNNFDFFPAVSLKRLKDKREKIKDNPDYKILSNDKVKILLKDNKLKVSVPIKNLPLEAKKIITKDDIQKFNNTEFFKRLYVEVKKFVGIPTEGQKARQTTDRLRAIIKKNKASIDIIFNVFPKKPDETPSLEEGTSFIETLRKEIKKLSNKQKKKKISKL